MKAKRICVCVIATMFSNGFTIAAPTLDASFNAGGAIPGTVLTDVGSTDDSARAVAVQPDGKVVIAGQASFNDFALARYNVDGALDTSFNGSGVVSGAGLSNVQGLVIQPDGRIIVVGVSFNGSDSDFAIARFTTDGSVDTNFGTNGQVVTDFGATDDFCHDVALQADGKLVVSGYRDVGAGGPSEFEYALARYDADGSLDAAFGSGGKVTTALGTNNDWSVYLTLQTDGKIIIASAFSAMGADLFLARYTSSGSLDTTFNPGGSLAAGVATIDAGETFESFVAVVVQPDGKIVAAGGSNDVIILARYNADGSLDATFDTDGVVNYDSGAGFESVNALALQPNGKILVAGNISNDAALVRFNADGSFDSAAVEVLGAFSMLGAVAVQPDGKLIAAGGASDGVDQDFVVARYDADDAIADTTPDNFDFTDVDDAAPDSVETSDMITIAGLGNGISVPVTVSGGEYARNGSSTYTSNQGWVRNGDTVNVRATASSDRDDTTSAVLTVGGLAPGNNLALVIGSTEAGIFAISTASGSDGSDGLAAIWLLVVLTVAWLSKAVRASRGNPRVNESRESTLKEQ